MSVGNANRGSNWRYARPTARSDGSGGRRDDGWRRAIGSGANSRQLGENCGGGQEPYVLSYSKRMPEIETQKIHYGKPGRIFPNDKRP